MSPDVGKSIVNRLRSAEGHLKAVTTMVENGASCEQILHQINAVKGSLNAISRILLDDYLQESERVIKQSKCPQERHQVLEALVLLYRLTVDSK